MQKAPSGPRVEDPARPRTPNLSTKITLLRFLDSNFPGSSLRAWEFHPSKLRFCLGQTL